LVSCSLWEPCVCGVTWRNAVNDDEQNKTPLLLVGCDLYVSNSWSVVKADDKKRTTSHACYGQRLGGSAAPILSVELQVPGHPNCQFIGRSLVPQMDAGVCRSMLTLPWTCCFEFVPASPLAADEHSDYSWSPYSLYQSSSCPMVQVYPNFFNVQLPELLICLVFWYKHSRSVSISTVGTRYWLLAAGPFSKCILFWSFRVYRGCYGVDVIK
jgi:hypothetical protein